MDAIAVTLAGDGHYTGLAPMGTSLTTNQADLLAVHSQPVILATDHDLAGHIAAERDFWRLAAQLQRDGAPTLRETLAHSTPAARQLQLERIRNLPADAALTQAAQVTAARPGSRWAGDVDWLARRLAVSQQTIEEHLAPLAQAWTADPRRCADDQIAASNVTRKRLQDHDPAAHWAQELAKIDPRLPEDPTWSYLVVALQAIQDEGLDPVVAARIIAEESPLGVSPASTLTVRLFDRLNLRPPSPALRTATTHPDGRLRDEQEPALSRRDHDIPTI